MKISSAKRYTLTCVICARSVQVDRADALTCSASCRVTLHRHPELKREGGVQLNEPLSPQQRPLPELYGADTLNVAQRMKALHHVWARLPAEAYDNLRERLGDVHWVLPDAETLGFVWKPKRATTEMIVYLAPKLEELSFDEVVDTVAHELAHVYHKHAEIAGGSVEYTRHEREAQRTVRMWGFAMQGERPYER